MAYWAVTGEDGETVFVETECEEKPQGYCSVGCSFTRLPRAPTEFDCFEDGQLAPDRELQARAQRRQTPMEERVAELERLLAQLTGVKNGQ